MKKIPHLGELSVEKAWELLQQGNQLFKNLEFDEGHKMWARALKIFREHNQHRGEGHALSYQGNSYYVSGGYLQANRCCKKSLSIARNVHDATLEGTALQTIGRIYAAQRDYSNAIASFNLSLELFRKTKDRYNEMNVLADIGHEQRIHGKYLDALTSYQNSLSIARKISAPEGEATAMGCLGTVYFSMGEYRKAIVYYQQQRDLARMMHNKMIEAQALSNLGSPYYLLKQYEEALAHYQECLIIAENAHMPEILAGTFGNIGSIYYSLGNYTEAITAYKKSLEIAQAQGDRYMAGNNLGNLGNVSRAIEDYTTALSFHKQHLEIAREISDPLGEGNQLNNLGLTCLRLKRWSDAEDYLCEGIKLWESLRAKLQDYDAYKIAIFEQQSRTYRILQQVLVKQKKTALALEVAERGRARAMIELLSSRMNPTQKSDQKQILPSILEMQRIAEDHHALIVTYSIITDEFSIRNKLEDMESDLFIWVVKPGREVAFRRVDLSVLWQKEETTLQELVISARKRIGARGRQEFSEHHFEQLAEDDQGLKMLYHLLIDPVIDLLPKNAKKRVIFIPQGPLFFVPFSALRGLDGKYLIEHHTILISPSIQILELTRQYQQRRGHSKLPKALIVGNPLMPTVSSEKLPNLPGARREALEIAKLLQSSALIGKHAVKAAVIPLMARAQIIHFATHGLLDDFSGQGIPGAIALAPSANDNGLLHSGEIMKMEIKAELAVLSACNTGHGKVTGDGIIGLARSFILAGVPSIIASLWSVPDSPTSFLMTNFYKYYLRTYDKALSLRLATLATMQHYPNPCDWAGFALIGEPE